MEVKETGYEDVDWINMSQDGVQWWVCFNTVMKFQITQMVGMTYQLLIAGITRHHSPDGPMTASSSPGLTTPLTSLSIGLLSTVTVTPLNTSSRERCWSRHGKWIVVLGTLDSTLQHKPKHKLMRNISWQEATCCLRMTTIELHAWADISPALHTVCLGFISQPED